MVKTVDQNIEEARQILIELETTTYDYYEYMIDAAVEELHKCLAEVGMDASVLDETGQSTAKEMEDRIKNAALRAKRLGANNTSADFLTNDGALTQKSQGAFQGDADTEEPAEEQKPENPDRALGDRAYEAMKGLVR